MTNSLQGKTAIITGGSTELASTVALKLAQAGVNICLCGRQADLLAISVDRIKQTGGKAFFVESSLGLLEEAQEVVNQTLSVYGGLDILTLISPFWSGGMIHSHNVKTWDLVIDANLREPFLMARAVLPILREQKRGEVMAIGSDSAMGIYQQDGAYAVAMHGLTTLMELIRAENAEFGIRAHILSPGLALSTPFDAEGKPNLTTDDVAEWVLWLLTRPSHLRGNSPILI
ncbi:MAG: SDR family oxidoreductase [Anaerolineae bacterium]|mgnify:FL=1|nr:SDR family oxidoreductase [Anaerolineae bacterium]